MGKQAHLKTGTDVRRTSQAGQFIGRAKDGTAIARPAFRPESFTVRELQKVIRDVLADENRAKAG